MDSSRLAAKFSVPGKKNRRDLVAVCSGWLDSEITSMARDSRLEPIRVSSHGSTHVFVACLCKSDFVHPRGCTKASSDFEAG